MGTGAARRLRPVNALRVAVDATPLLGEPTGVGAFVAGALGALAAGVRPLPRPMAAGALLQAWARFDRPPAEWWTGAVDVVHGTNFCVPPTRRAGQVVTVHDLTPVRYPELARRSASLFPALVRRASSG